MVFIVCDVLKVTVKVLKSKKTVIENFLTIKPTRCTNFSNLFWK
jgi:hypothetical protein